MSTLSKTYIFIDYKKDIPKLSPLASKPGAMIDSQWLELPMSRTNSIVPKFGCTVQRNPLDTRNT